MTSDFKKYQNIAVIIAHQDDEVPIAWLLKNLLKEQHNITIYLLTSGATTNQPEMAAIRNREFLKALASLGFSLKQIVFIGDHLRIPDGDLHNFLPLVFNELHAHLRKQRPSLLLTLCNEGGHQDHDSCNFLCRRLRKLIAADLISYSLYNGFKTYKKLFKVGLPLSAHGSLFTEPLTIKNQLLIIRHLFFYPSQKITWLALGPLLILKNLTFKMLFQRDNHLVVPLKPHDGPLLYERYDRVSFDKVYQSFHNYQDP